MEDFAIALSNGIRPLNNSKLFRKWMEAHFGRDVLEVCINSKDKICQVFRIDFSVMESIDFTSRDDCIVIIHVCCSSALQKPKTQPGKNLILNVVASRIEKVIFSISVLIN